MRTIAALFVDPLGIYPKLPGVDCWPESRDARTYAGPHPLVAHPPCGPWSKLRHLCSEATLATADCGPRAVRQVRRWGGVLEHPAHSRLWPHCELPPPAGGHDEHGGYSIEVNQVSWGHVCVKATWLYLVGVPGATMRAGLRTGGKATHCISWDSERARRNGYTLRRTSSVTGRRTPPLFAEWLVSLARASRVLGAA